MPKIKHRSSRRVPPPKDSDFDHEIKLVDHSAPEPRAPGDDEAPLTGPSREVAELPEDAAGPSTFPHQSSGAGSVVSPGQGDGDSIRGRKLSSVTGRPSIHLEQPTPHVDDIDQTKAGKQTIKTKPKSPETAIDILYENQRGGFLCGKALFSSKALGNLDPPAWTNSFHKPSPTDIKTAQVPDPSWEWAWPEWRINHDEGDDEDGWKYSFMFSKKFSWHKAKWWNSFVRRRAWIRKRVKKGSGYLAQGDPHMLNPEYFTVRPSSELQRGGLDRSPSRATSQRGSTRLSMSTTGGNLDGDVEKPIIEDTEGLLRFLRRSRIDREKIEAVDNYLEHAEEDLARLQEVMHEIMAIFVFQASRRVLLTRLTEVYDKTVEEQEMEKDENNSARLKRKAENLRAAISHADEEVRRLEYWSDVKGMAEEGDSKGAVDHSQGWDPTWTGLDKSGPAEPNPKHADE
ncbi:hypothetical protein QBC46DRAFT_458443 [Diplogelasinospora grovesii]|uniref:Meiotically up-regulated 65 protein n=1 Tax=Diplogelasinospora grovesii TaxID=303347 RepID=A0AAN6N8Q7_9PEZI|nr:hypothetical protein QBC46DRAFT_458443 [Diplogelasinospora grovesii]